MLQVNTIILWAEPRKHVLEDIVSRGFNTLNTLRGFGPEISPNYLTVSRKKYAKPFEWSYESFKETLVYRGDRINSSEGNEMGYSISFFSSLIEKESASISMTIGASDSQFKDVLVVSIPQSVPIYNDNKAADSIVSIFKKCVIAFQPYWGCIVNKVNLRRYEGYFTGTLPTTIHWMNFWSNQIVSQVGENKTESIPIYSIERAESGYFLRLKETPIDDENTQDVNTQQTINKYLAL